jgi:hypothetical protein
VVRIHPCPPKALLSAREGIMREWRNWQTR